MKKILISTGLALLGAASTFAMPLRHAAFQSIERNPGMQVHPAMPIEFNLPEEAVSRKAASSEDWNVIGVGTMTDFVLADLFWSNSPKTFTVTVEQSATDPNTYRIEHPYENWSDPSFNRYVKYDESKSTPMVIHVYDGRYAWFEEFDTGLDIDLTFAGFPDSGELTIKMWGEDKVREHGIEQVAANGPSALCGFTDGILSMSAFGSFNGESNHNILCDIGGKLAAGGNYYVANYNGEFRIVLPNSSADAEWQYLGTGSMSEFVFSGLFGVAPQSVKVEVEQSVIDPSKYRIKAPYAEWYDPQLSSITTFDSDLATPMIIHVEFDRWAWFESFDTGVYLNYLGSDGTVLRGEVAVTQQAEALVTNYGADYAITNWPDAFCSNSSGRLTLGKSFTIGNQEYSNVLVQIGSSDQYYGGNYLGNFSIQLPTSGMNDDADWEKVGTADFTDDIATILYGGQNTDYQTWKVELQRYKTDATMYRLINPYAGWKNPFSDVEYDDTNAHHLVVYTLPALGLACISDFETGLYLQGMGMMGVTTDAYYYSMMYGLDFTAGVMPEIFATYANDEITYPATILLEGERYPSMFAWFGTYSDDALYQVNSSGKFRIKFNFGEEMDGVEAIQESDFQEEYFTLQGVRIDRPERGQIVIVKKGCKTFKKVF